MCGICGIVDWKGRPIDRGLVERMRDVMRSRGPDEAGLHIEPGGPDSLGGSGGPGDLASRAGAGSPAGSAGSSSSPSIALGHRRLKVIDLSPAAGQPMTNEDESLWLVFNGEIYNFQDLRCQLDAAGHRFRSRSDTEVILHGYEQWGIEGLAQRITGMFALALWDRPRRQLCLLRDHVGKKPLFYRHEGGRLWFASDIKPLWLAANAMGQSLTMDEQALDEFLYYYYISQERTIFRTVHKLPPAHFATIDERGVHLTCYWRPDYSHKETRTRDEWLEGLDHHFRQAVRRRLISDVPLGAFLSGGVDSSCVCALMAQEGSSRPKTFSVGFSDAPRWDERPYSRRVAEHIGSDHTELVVDPDAAAHLSSIVWHYGEPYGDSSAIPSYLIAQQARQHVTVVLSGDGGDEAFAGYSRHLRADLPRHNGWMTPLLRNGVMPLLARAATALAPATLAARNFEQYADYLRGSSRAFAAGTCWYDGLRTRLYSADLRRRLGGYHPREAQRALLSSLHGPTPVDRALEYLMRTVLPGDYLVKVDVATMAHGLELRCPLLDKDLLGFAQTIPAELLIEGHQAKALLKRYAERLVPREVIYRKKHGFSVPIRQWFSTTWRGPVRELLLSPAALGRGYFEPHTIRRVLDEHAAGRRNHTPRIWTLLVLEIWHRLFIDCSLEPGEPVLGTTAKGTKGT